MLFHWGCKYKVNQLLNKNQADIENFNNKFHHKISQVKFSHQDSYFLYKFSETVCLEMQMRPCAI